jgi:uncharacterized protein YgbK (DUF1537 family)
VTPLPEGPLVAWYGDDFTGSAAVMEVLSFAGFPATLFLEPPSPERLAGAGAPRGIGVAGDARSRPPAWMDARLPAIFAALRRLGAPLLHYKVCSTLDSAPHVGSIGRAAEIALGPDDWAALIVAAPAIGRWQAFGNLFARAGDGASHRLDRHPTMRAHPVTPMDEADVRRHLARQTDVPVGLVDLADLAAGDGAARLAAELRRGARIVAIDVTDEATLAAAGRLVWETAGGVRVVIGSQGVEYALVAAWRAAGLAPEPPAPPPVAAAGRIAAVSGSCSPVTAAQIAVAEASGFAIVALDARRAASAADWAAECARGTDAGLAALAAGRSPILATARGPDDPAIAAAEAARGAAGLSAEDFNARVGAGLGAALERMLRTAGLRRAAIAGGDTSSHAAAALGLYAFEAVAPLAPGAPLLRGRADEPARDGLEIALKGGQMGPPDFFVRLRDGAAA